MKVFRQKRTCHVSQKLPELRIARSSLYKWSRKESFVAPMDGIVRVVCGGDQILRIEDLLVVFDDVPRSHRIQMMNRRTTMNLKSRNTEITSVISVDYEVANTSPLLGSIESLVDVAIESEGCFPDPLSKIEIAKTFLESDVPSEF